MLERGNFLYVCGDEPFSGWEWTVYGQFSHSVSSDWRDYLTTTDKIEAATGFDFFSKVTKKIQAKIESHKDN